MKTNMYLLTNPKNPRTGRIIGSKYNALTNKYRLMSLAFTPSVIPTNVNNIDAKITVNEKIKILKPNPNKTIAINRLLINASNPNEITFDQIYSSNFNGVTNSDVNVFCRLSSRINPPMK